MLFRVWEGGMSFHGGFLGVIVAVFFYSKSIKKEFWESIDFVAPCVPFGLGDVLKFYWRRTLGSSYRSLLGNDISSCR